MVQAMIRDPACRMAGAVEDGPEDQDLLDDPVGLEGLVGQHAVIADGRAEPAKSNTEQCHANNLRLGNREEDQADDGKNVNENEISKDAFFAVERVSRRVGPRGALVALRSIPCALRRSALLLRECPVWQNVIGNHKNTIFRRGALQGYTEANTKVTSL